ncbi:MAG TPA: M1 family metallopeptidase [Propionibacteriaceae bacterium]|nr:M1 family metallopeptidase [Propionibacteriaceae bacterium]
MSSAELSASGPSHKPPPAPLRRRPRRTRRLLAVVIPLVLLVLVTVPWGISRLVDTSSAAAPAGDAGAAEGGSEGANGVGDPYFPTYGSGGYDALKYAISVSWDAANEELTGTTVATARATQPLSSFYLDLALATRAVRVNDRPATFSRSGRSDLKITPAQPIAAGTMFRVAVDYSGKPGRVKGVSAWWSSKQEWTIAGEPESSTLWFPANDHPSDPALMDVSIRVPAGMTAVSVGRLESKDSASEAEFDTWHWVAAQPVASYLNFMAIGSYDLRQGTADGRPYVYAVSSQLPSADRSRAFAALARTAPILRTLETMFGPYPFTEIGGVVPAAALPFGGLETQTRPVYSAADLLDDAGSRYLIAHELAHMWYGDNVTLKHWNDIFTNEAYASWAAWGYAERTGGKSADAIMLAAYERLKGEAGFWKITMIDPGRDHLFDAVYQRGPMTLQALRNVIGDPAFFSLAREWGQQPGSRSLEEWMATAQSKTEVDLKPFFQAWIYSPTAPARTAANGLR